MNYHTCPICEESFPLTPEFWRRKSRRQSGLETGMCKACRCERDAVSRNKAKPMAPVHKAVAGFLSPVMVSFERNR